MTENKFNKHNLLRIAKYLAAAGLAVPIGYCMLVIAGVADGAEFSVKEMMTNAKIAFVALETCAAGVWIASRFTGKKDKAK